MTKRVVLINLNYQDEIFSRSKVRAAISPGTTPLGLVSIAAPVLAAGHEVKIADLNLLDKPSYEESGIFDADIVGITATTPLIYKAYKIAELVKKHNKNSTVIIGGPHASAFPEDVLRESQIDCAVRGEGDFVIKSIIEKGLTIDIPNTYFKKNGEIVASPVQGHCIDDLDQLPFPAYSLLNIKNYNQPKIASRKAPMGYLETSRGCYGRCIFCNKNINGYRMRMKTPKKVVNEMEKMLELGFKEIQIIDDIFTADIKRATAICEEILKKGLVFDWYPRGGIRVDRVNRQLLEIMKRAGCYRIPFGVESGSQRILDIMDKRITLKQAEEAVRLAKESGMETECYFMIGNPTETEDDIKKSLEFAKKLDPDYVKFAITIPLPGTPLFDMMSKRGQIKTRQWDKYNFSISPKELYEHDVLSWDVIDRYYSISHREFYLRSKYMGKMFRKTVLDGTMFEHAKAFLKTRW